MSDVTHLPGCDQANPKLWDAPCNCAEIRAEGIKYAYMEWQDKTEWVQKTAKPSELGKHRADVMRERIAKAEAERDQLRAELEAIRGQQPDTWPTLDKPAKVGAVLFNPGLSARLVVEAAQRQHEYSQQPEVEAARLERFKRAMREFHGEQPDAVSVPREELEALRRDKQLLDAIQDGCWDVRYNSSPIADTGDYDTGVEVIGHFMQAPHERILGEDFGADVRKAIAQAMTAEAYPPARPEYDNWGRPLRALSTKNAGEGE